MKAASRSTFVTGVIRIGESFRQVTVRCLSDSTYAAVTVAGAAIDPWSVEWRTLRTIRNAAAASIHADGRLSSAGPNMFAFRAAALTGRNGQLKAGRAYDFAHFVEHMIHVGGDSTWHGETVDDRAADAAAMLAQESWLL